MMMSDESRPVSRVKKVTHALWLQKPSYTPKLDKQTWMTFHLTLHKVETEATWVQHGCLSVLREL